MYYFYFGKVLFPIAPESMETTIKGNNSTITLINEGEINQIKSPKLTEFKFDLLLPQITNYPFATYKTYKEKKVSSSPVPLTIFSSEFQPASYYLEKIESFKNKTKGFEFKVVRRAPSNPSKTLFDTTMTVTLEDYTIKEDAGNGLDVTVSVTLKKYVKYGTKKVTVKKSSSNKKILTKKQTRTVNKNLPTTHTVAKSDTLYSIAKKYYTSGNKTYKQAIYNKNKTAIEKAAKKNGRSSSVSGKYLYKGTKLTIPKIK